MTRLKLSLLLGLVMTACSSMQKPSVSRVPAAALIVGRDGGVILIHKSQNGMYAIKQCQDFVPVNKEQDCRLGPGTEIREVTKQQIVGEISRILQLPRFKPEVSEEISKRKRAEQAQLFRCAENLSILKYEVYRRQQFGKAYGFFKEDLSKLEGLLKKSEKVSCSSTGINKIQDEIDSLNRGVVTDIIAMIESEELHIISSPQAGKSKETVPLDTELANGLVRSSKITDEQQDLPEWILEKDHMNNPLRLGFKEAFKHCKATNRRLPTIAELAAYAGTKGANYFSYDNKGSVTGERIGSVEVEDINEENGSFTFQRYYKFWYERAKYKIDEKDFFPIGGYVFWSSSIADDGKMSEIFHLHSMSGDIGRTKGLKKEMAVICVSSEDRNSFKLKEQRTKKW